MNSQSRSFVENLRWRKLSQPHLAKYSEDSEEESANTSRQSLLQRVDNIGGYSTVIQAGASPSFILKEASSAPTVIGLRGKTIRSLSGFHTTKCDRGFVSVDADVSSFNLFDLITPLINE
jgi:cleavage and polyadenylation specificity factor subunit 1